ncbi:helix-turn-helix transcriptional regulator [Halomontanus rarus]|uniref:helix-turn-helix transcriptional regulator n=1 Tax=Halomontanus rarus TaxID=3034020 RepID=UPI0023E80B24|nr:hypothetical protein [Halovivax sp. TS33]
MKSDERDDAIALLRHASVLEACRDRPRSRRELVAETNTSRTTIYRVTVSFEERGLLEDTAGGYRTTAQGEALSRLTDTYLDGREAIERLEPLFEYVSDPDLLANAHRLTDATVTVVDASNPYRVAERSIERFEAASDVRGAVSKASPSEMLEDAEAILETKSEISWIFAESAFDAHRTVGGDTFRAALDAPHISLRVAPDDRVPFTFSVDRDDISISGHDPTSGLPTVIVESSSPAAKLWLENRFETLFETATPLEEWLD